MTDFAKLQRLDLPGAYDFVDHYRTSILRQAPSIDGHVDADEWRDALRFEGLSFHGALEERRCVVHAGATKSHLYFAIISELPPEGELRADVEGPNGNLAFDDSVELWIEPTPLEPNSVVYQMLTNFRGRHRYQTHTRGQVPRETHMNWRGDYTIAHGFHEGAWHCEVAVPVESVAPGRQVTEKCWGLNIARDFNQPWGFASLGNREYLDTRTILFEFVESGSPVVQMRHGADPTTGDLDIGVEIRNTGHTPRTYLADCLLIRDQMPDIHVLRELELAGGEMDVARLADYDLSTTRYDLCVVVSEEDGQPVYTRYYHWGRGREQRWQTRSVEVHPVDFRFAYYPSLNRLRLQGDITRLPGEARLDAMRLAIFRTDPVGKDAVASLTMHAGDFDAGLCERMIDLPPLEGEYRIEATFEGENVPAESVTHSFVRRRYPWEGQSLGTSRRVYAPFEPVRVAGRDVRTVMKTYRLGETGLLDSVRTLDQAGLAEEELLAGPMRYRATIAGTPVEVHDASLKFLEQADDRVVAICRWNAGGLQAQARCTIEYDGLLRVDLTLDGAGVPVDALDLEIPVRDDIARLLHAQTSHAGLTPWTGTVPEGQGVVWSASDMFVTEWMENFCSYLFLGNAVRGLCWFAENDAGWSWNSDTPNLDVSRRGNQVVLRVHLISTPLEVSEPRTLTFGLMAAPVKPRLDGWRHRWYTDEYSILGCDIHWFGEANCSNVYPARKDLELWRMIRKANEQGLTDLEIRQTLDRATPYFAPQGERRVQEMLSTAGQNLQNRRGKRLIFYYNRASAPLIEEFQTFMDEWCLNDYNPYRGLNTFGEIKVVPTPSYMDFALHWVGQSIDVAGNQGVYIDNSYLKASSNRMMTAAHADASGHVRPSNGIWQLREFFKRTFVYLCERGMEPILMNHTSTTQNIATNAFFTVQYEGEAHFSEGDLHDRYPREYLQLLSTGEHAGTWPILLHDQGELVADAWTIRTYLGATMVHEILVDPYIWHGRPIGPEDVVETRLFKTFRQPVLEFVQHADVEVYRYWDGRPQPATVIDADAPTIVYVRKGVETIVVVTSYASEERQVTLRIDRAALGLEGSLRVIDADGEETRTMEDDELRFTIARHDIKEFRLTATA